MARLLVIDSDRRDLAALQSALTGAGHHVNAVPSGSFALTMLERDQPDVIVSRTKVADIDGYDLCTIVRSDSATRSIPFLLLASVAEGATGTAAQFGADGLLAANSTLEAIVAEVNRLLDRQPSEVRVEPPPPPKPASRPAGPTRSLHGSLGVMDLPDVTQAIAIGGKTGRLLISLAAGEGSVVFDSGRVVHAEFAELSGERAYAAMVATAHREAGGEFSFTPAETTGVPRTINRSVEQLLLSIAADIDEGRTNSTTHAPRA